MKGKGTYELAWFYEPEFLPLYELNNLENLSVLEQ